MPAIDYHLKLKVNGTPFKDRDLDDVTDLVVDSDYFLPTMFEITLRDTQDDTSHNLLYADGSTFKIGSAVEISMSAEVEDDTVDGVLVKGEITAIEPVFSADGRPIFRVRGYDRSHRLTRGKKTRVFGDGKSPTSINEQGIINKIIGEAGLSAKIDSSGLSSLQYPYVMQYNQTDWDFLWSRARAFGYQVYMDDRILNFQKAGAVRGGGATPPELKWGDTLASFEPRVSLAGQSTEAEVRGWDADKKQAIVSKATSASLDMPVKIGFEEKAGSAFRKKTFSAASEVSVDQPVFTENIAKVQANAQLSACENEFVQADGFLQRGNPQLLAGRQVEITNVGRRFSGTYYLTKARHQYRQGRYTVQFSVSGNSPHTLYGALQPPASSDGKIYGPVIGIVTNNTDPEKLGQVKVKFPWLNDSYESNLARVCSPDAGPERGLYLLPEVNDEVLVAFEHGDINFPYIIGSLWNKKDKPPKGSGEIVSGGKVNQRVMRSRTGHRVIMDDTQGKEQILVENNTGKISICLASKDNSITIKSQGDFSIETQGKFEVKAVGDVLLDTKGAAKFNAVKNLDIESKQGSQIKTPTASLALKPAGAELKGVKVDVKADTLASVSGSAMVEVKGAMVKIN